jgi:hypothetical protein
MSQEPEIRMGKPRRQVKIREYGSEKEDDVANDLGIEKRVIEKGRGVRTRINREYSGGIKEREEKS